MKFPHSRYALGCILCLLPWADIFSAPGADRSSISSATISGRVVNEVTGRYLNNARVTAREANLQVFVGRVFFQQSKRSDILPAYARTRNHISWDGINTNRGIKGSF